MVEKAEKIEMISYKKVSGYMVIIITTLGAVCWFFFTSFYGSVIEIQKSLQEIKLSMVKIQAEMMDETRVRLIARDELRRMTQENKEEKR